jgi:Mn2+/Fe2+ NRAMP family transporter
MDKKSLKDLFASIGPGILFAGAAIGGSHLVQSTRAGANYGYALAGIIILILILKYPFFQYSHRFTAISGKNLIEGYREQGQWVLGLFAFFAIIVGVINVAAVTLVTGGLASLLLGWQIHPGVSSALVLILVSMLIIIGRYPLLDSSMKIMVSILAFFTISAAFIALSQSADKILEPVEWDTFQNISGIAFLLALMGWMPAPIDISVWTSIWIQERYKQTKHIPSLRESMIDYNIGYITTGILALAFLTLGALVMRPSGEIFSNSSVTFAGQLVSLYAATLGEWSRWIIAVIAFITMFSTTLSTVDGYSRTLTESVKWLFFFGKRPPQLLFWIILGLLTLLALQIIIFILSGIKTLVDTATILAFLTAPVFAILNFRLVTSPKFPNKDHPGKLMQVLSWSGIVFLSGFSLLYLYLLIFK